MRIHILSVLLGVTATLLAGVLFWPETTPRAAAQNDAVLSLDAEWNNVAYGGDPLGVAAALNDAVGITEAVWLWRSLQKQWDSWTLGVPDSLNSLGSLDRGDIVWIRTSRAGSWTQIGAAPAAVAGPAGLSCWDSNVDGVFDADEDQDGDGVATVLDCRGPQGVAGELGPEGPMGPSAAATAAAGGGVEHNNLPPSNTLSCLVATTGVFPSVTGAQAEAPILGQIRWFAGTFAPRGWEFCDGQLLSIAANSALFAIIGTLYGGDGVTTFALPDLRGRTLVHEGTGPGLTTRSLGSAFGSEVEVLTENQMASHAHLIP